MGHNAAAAGKADASDVPTRPDGAGGRPPRRGHPLGPLIRMLPLERPTVGRLYAAGLVAGVVAVFAVAARLHPQGLSLGAHQQLGLPPCGFITTVGLPCPTCGMTTAFAYTIRGRPAAALSAQPAGFLLALGTLGAGLAAILALVTGRAPAVNWYRVNPVTVVWVGAGLFVLAWGVKILSYKLQADATAPGRF